MLATRRSQLTVLAAALASLALITGFVLTNRPTGPRLDAPAAGTTVTAAQSANGPVDVGNGVKVGASQKNDHSPALRTIKAIPPRPLPAESDQDTEHTDRSPVKANDPVRQTSQPAVAMPSTALNFEGIDFPGVSCNCAPPDTNGEAGATQYVQMVNEGFQVFDKNTGASLYGPASIVTVWSGFGGVCQSAGDGDPVVLYDQIANRWVLSQFAGSSTPTDECIAVSQTSDATGAWNRYDFHLGSNFMDYPHGAVWPDGYYFTFNVYNSGGTAFLGPQTIAFDRTKMLAGQAATFVAPTGPLGSTVDPMLPADLDGSTLPPAGAPATIVRWPGTGTFETYHFHVDFTTPASSTWSLFGAPASAGFTELCPTTRACVPEPNGATVDGIGDRLMFRLAYRNFGDHESVVGNFSVNSGGTAAVRWFELRNVTSGPESVFQQGTFQPDSTWRWMGSAAMDKFGDIAVGYSASSSSVNPSLRYAGRLSTDPLNTLGQGEAVLFAGLGSQTGTVNRWGDYSDMTVDPVDDCTFWFTSEYYPAGSSQFNWRTRIGSFKFPGCGGSPTTGGISGTVTDSNNGLAISGATVTLSGGGSGSTTTDGSGNYSFSNLTPAGYTVTASKSTYTANASSSKGVTVTAGNTSTANLSLTSTLGSITGHVTDATTHAAISGASVTITSGGSGSATTDATGAYTISGLAAGSYNLSAAKSGYVTGNNTAVAVTAGQPTTSDFALTAVVTSSTGYRWPTAFSAVAGAGDGNGYQTVPANWYSSFDGIVATDGSSGTGSSQTCGSSLRDQEILNGFSFGSLGSGTILGIQVQIRGRVNSASNSPKFCVQLWNGTTWGAGKVTSALKTSLTTYTLGTTSDLWGQTWSSAIFAAGFQVRITDLANSTTKTFSLDGVSVNVTYQ
ncbi:MAG TPA: carboxypeptidase-like regulatory domain-containing protein [Candidatus Limnocylindrales bacterium]